tara:strand:- start:26111 stop:27085 length:975 start_codon:yes stop_codon:yes gene_type:complete
MKKAQISPVFKYIFIAIVGAMVLAFFVRFAFQQIDVGTKLNTIKVAITLDHNLDAFSVSKSSDKDLDLGTNTNVLFNHLICNTIALEGGNNIKTNKIIFSPQKIQGRSIQAWTFGWFYPFHVTNFFYLSNPKAVYYLVYDSFSEEVVEEFFDKNNIYNIPSRFNVRKIAINKVNAQLVSSLEPRFDFVKFIFFTNPNIRSSDKIKVVSIGPDVITFYEDTQKNEVNLGNEFILGAIFTEDYDSYLCNFKSAVNDLKIISGLYLDKRSEILSKYECDYSVISSNLGYFKNNDPSINNLETYRRNKDLLMLNNNELYGVENCEALF